MIEALTANGEALADALRLGGLLPAEYEKWRGEYAGLLRTLGALSCAPPYALRKSTRAGRGRSPRTSESRILSGPRLDDPDAL